jgi:hypothetical protein
LSTVTEDFSCSLDLLYGGLIISKLRFLIRKRRRKIFSCIFFFSSNLWSPITLDPDPELESLEMLDPDPELELLEMLDPDPELESLEMLDPDPQHCLPLVIPCLSLPPQVIPSLTYLLPHSPFPSPTASLTLHALMLLHIQNYYT